MVLDGNHCIRSRTSSADHGYSRATFVPECDCALPSRPSSGESLDTGDESDP